MASPTYAKNKIHQLAYQRKNREKCSERRMISYYKLKDIFHRETATLGRISLNIFQ